MLQRLCVLLVGVQAGTAPLDISMAISQKARKVQALSSTLSQKKM